MISRSRVLFTALAGGGAMLATAPAFSQVDAVVEGGAYRRDRPAQIGTAASGNQLVNAPPITLNLGLDCERPLGNLTAGFSTNYLFNGGFYWDPGNRRDVRQDAYGVTLGFKFGR